MAVRHVNRKGQTFYLHETRTKTGKPKYSFSMKEDGVLVESIPEGHEVYENPDAQVFLRKKLPRFITDQEIAVVREGLRKHARGRHCMADVREKHIVVYHSERGDLYQKVLRFTLIDEDRPPVRRRTLVLPGVDRRLDSPLRRRGPRPRWSSDTARTSARNRSSS